MHNVQQKLQEVFTARPSSCGHGSPMIRYGAEDLETGFEIFFQIHDGCYVAAAVTIVGGRPDGNDVFVFEVILQAVSVWI